MEENNNTTDQVEEFASPDDKPGVVEFMGDYYDTNDETGKAAYNAAKNTLQKVLGRTSQEVGTLRKEVPYVKKFGLKANSSTAAGKFAEIAKLSEEGDTEKALNMMVDLYKNREQELASKAAESDFRAAYEQSRADVFDVLEPDMAWDYVFSNYREELSEVEDPIKFVDSILLPKAEKILSRLKPSDSDSIVKDQSEENFSLGKGQTKKIVRSKAKPEPESKPAKFDQAAFDSIFE